MGTYDTLRFFSTIGVTSMCRIMGGPSLLCLRSRLPDTDYIAMQEVCDKIQEAVRQVSVPVMADGDTGFGSPMNVRRTVECFACSGAAGIMIEDQTWPKREFQYYGCFTL
jgi:2-methylisocitrate lyase-like PEP mutase family enzyme